MSAGLLRMREVTLGLVLILALGVSARAQSEEQRIKLDCGVNALFVLMQLEGRPVTIQQLEQALPKPDPRGYSMAELAKAAESLGVSLDGVRFGKGDRPLDRPAIAFVQDGNAGHFAVLRPVGNTGTMVQVIDPPHVPWITDYDRLFTAKPWTGRILTRKDSRRLWQGVASVPAVASLLFLGARRIGRHWSSDLEDARETSPSP